jgi:hypothetical protein
MTLDARGRSAAAALRRAAAADVEVETMLDRITQDSRRNRALTAGAVFVAAALIVSLGWAVFRPLESASVTPGVTTPSATPTSSPTAAYTTTRFEDPFTVVVPRWVTQVGTPIDGAYQSSSRVIWNRCTLLSECIPIAGSTWKHCPDGSECIALSFSKFAKVQVSGGSPDTYRDMPGYAGYVASMESLAGSGEVTLSDVSTTTVGGRPATVMTVTPSKDMAGAVGCYVGNGIGDDCVDFFTGVTTRMAVVDTGGTPLVILSRTPAANPMEQVWLAQFDQMLRTVRFLGTTSP